MLVCINAFVCKPVFPVCFFSFFNPNELVQSESLTPWICLCFGKNICWDHVSPNTSKSGLITDLQSSSNKLSFPLEPSHLFLSFIHSSSRFQTHLLYYWFPFIGFAARELSVQTLSAKSFPGVGLNMSAGGDIMEMAPKVSELQKPHTDLKLRGWAAVQWSITEYNTVQRSEGEGKKSTQIQDMHEPWLKSSCPDSMYIQYIQSFYN